MFSLIQYVIEFMLYLHKCEIQMLPEMYSFNISPYLQIYIYLSFMAWRTKRIQRAQDEFIRTWHLWRKIVYINWFFLSVMYLADCLYLYLDRYSKQIDVIDIFKTLIKE